MTTDQNDQNDQQPAQETMFPFPFGSTFSSDESAPEQSAKE